VSQPRNHHRIFIVDDEHVITSTLAMILRNQGFEATSFTEPLDALEAALCEAPDLLISDVMMPRLSGIELAIEVRKHCPECKVLLFSGALLHGSSEGRAFPLPISVRPRFSAAGRSPGVPRPAYG